MALQLQLHALQGRALEYLTNGQSCTFQAFQQRFRLDGLVTVDIDLTDARPLRHHDHQHIAVPANADIIKVPGNKQAAHGLAQGVLVNNIAHANG